MYAIRARRKVATERDFLDAVEKVVRQGTKFSSTYVVYLCCEPLFITDRIIAVPSIRCTISVDVNSFFYILVFSFILYAHALLNRQEEREERSLIS